MIMRALVLATVCAATLLAGCDGSSPAAAAISSSSSAPAAPTLSYSGGTCPVLVAGVNTLQSAGRTRRALIALPGEPQGKPIIFGWHWLEGDPFQFYFATGLFARSDVIVVVPFATDDQRFLWHLEQGPNDNPDLILFDDLLTCLDEQFAIDRERVWTMGMSAGALWTAYLIQYRSERLAAAALLSGGLPDPNFSPGYVSPRSAIPVALEWGGDDDVFTFPGLSFAYNNGTPDTFSFAVASRTFSTLLRGDGHFVLECIGTQGHTLPPPDPAAIWWPFLRDHPRGISPDPYLTALPADLSPLCAVP